MGNIRSITPYIVPKVQYVDTPGAAAFLSDALDVTGSRATTWLVAVGANDEAVTAKVTESAAADGTYTDITGAAAALVHTGTASRLYLVECRNSMQFQKLSVTSTPTAAIEYMVTAIGHDLPEIPKA